MASTSSSHSLEDADVSLRLVDAKSGRAMVFDCVEGTAHAGIDLRCALADRGSYSVSLLSTVDFGQADVSLRVKGEKPIERVLSPVPAEEGDYVAEYRFMADGGWHKPFKYAYGFVQLELEISAGGVARSLRTKEIPCSSCTIPNLKRHVVGMLDALLGPDLAKAMALMTVKGEDGAPVDESATGEGSASLEVFAAHADSVLSVVESVMPALKLKPRTKTRESRATVVPERARRVGRGEIEWLGRNPDAIRVQKGLPLGKRGAKWGVSRVQTAMSVVSLDVAENTAVLGLLSDIARVAGLFASTLRSGVEDLAVAKEKLSAIAVDNGCLPSLVIIEAQIEKARPRIEMAEGVQRRARRDLMVLEMVWGLEPPRGYSLPRRSKAFQEVSHYAKVYKAMLEWFEFGRLDLDREALMLEVRNMPRLYELFCLAKMIDRHIRDGYKALEPDQVRYSLSSRYFGNEARVANKYAFSKGRVNATLWYQAVFYSDVREEGGVDVHRTTKWVKDSKSGDSYWTPDFVLRQDRPDGSSRVVVLDSKYTEPRFCREKGYFDDCLDKYKHCSARSGGRPVDSVWLLAGRGSAGEGWSTALGSWAVESGLLPDGVCVLTPFVDELGHAVPAVETPGGAAAAKGAGEAKAQPAVPEKVQVAVKEAVEVKPEPEAPEEPAKERGGAGGMEMPPALLEVMGLLSEIASNPLGRDSLTDGKESQKLFGVSHPVCRKRQPTGRDRRLYTKDVVEIGEGSFYVYKAWRPDQVNKLRRAHSRLFS